MSIDIIKESVSDYLDKIKDKIRDIKKWIVRNRPDPISFIMNNKVTILFIVSVLAAISTDQYLQWAIIFAILYMLILITKVANFRMRMKEMKEVDINFFNFQNTAGLDPMDAYINDCFQRYILLYRGFKQGSYVTEKDEKKMLADLISSVSENLSPVMRRKFELYYGPGMTDLLATKCYITVSLYSANEKKPIYDNGNSDEKNNMEEMMKEMMLQ